MQHELRKSWSSQQASHAEVLNRDCHCIAVERSQLDLALDRDLESGELRDRLREVQHQLFADSPVFVSREHVEKMAGIVDAVSEAVALSGYRDTVMARSLEVARQDRARPEASSATTFTSAIAIVGLS